MMTRAKTEQEIAYMREGGHMLATVLELMKRRTAPGKTPKEMSHIAAEELKRLGGEPAFKGVRIHPSVPAYPDIICISVNDQVQHSIPSDLPFEEGDVVNYDFGVRYHGMITDGGITVGVGAISADAQRLLHGTDKALHAGLSVIRAGCHVGDISAAVERVLRSHKLGIVRELVGHGVGHDLHEDPNIPNYGKAGRGPILKTGMTVAIEPIANLGRGNIFVDSDGWTIRASDGSLSAQFEHTVLVQPNGIEILTKL